MQVQTVDLKSESAGRDFAASLHETGFAVLKNHPIRQAELENLYARWAAFFLSDERMQFQYDPDSEVGTQAGYVPASVSETAVGHSTRDLKEFFHVAHEFPLPPDCAKHTLDYRETAFRFSVELLGLLQQSMPDEVRESLSEPLSGMLSLDDSMLRILHYPPLDGDEDADAIRAAAHEDINLITILPVSNQGGLQVQDNSGRWIDVSSIRGEIIINSGDMLQEATGGYFPSTTHRVVNPGGEVENVSRISIPFFLSARPDVVLSDRYTAGSYLDERLRLLNR